MDTNHSHHCPSCGTLLDRDADSLADGLCPRCLLESSLHSTIAGQPSASPPPPVEEVSAAFPDLEIIELIGRGGMGAVYKARQKSLDRPVALKLLPRSLAADPEFAKRFEAEAKALATLNHPNIVTVHEFGQRGDFYFLLMEYVDGPNLRSLLVDHRLSPHEALAIVPPLCDALEFAHQRNIVHCDIKPENLILNTDGKVKIADFGIARILGQTSTDAEPEKAAGTPAYMAPEQKDSPHSIDTRTDIYSLGVVIYEMLTGERPGADLTPPSGKNSALDVRLDKIVLRALDANPKLRWQSANELNSELQTILTEALGEPKVTPPDKLPTSSPKRAWVACALAFTALVLLIGVFFAHKHVAPVSATEHQESIDRWFEHQVEMAETSTQYQALEAKPDKTPADKEVMEDLWEKISDGWVTLELFDALRGVGDPVLSNVGYAFGVRIAAILAVAAFFLGRRHLSWLRGQKEPLPALKAGLVGALLGPLLFTSGLILTAVLRYESVLTNTLALTGAFLLALWTVRRVIAWTRNLRNAPPLGVVPVFAAALIALAIAIPLTAATETYTSTLQKLASESSELEQSSQKFIAYMHLNHRESETEKLEEAKLGCEEHAHKSQSFYLLNNKPLRLLVPEGSDLLKSVIGSVLAFAAALVILKKSRNRRA